jgi:HAD superfamily hydrolase (TIGR01509 family)
MPFPGALIFDLDGTLADTQPVWRSAEAAFFRSIGQEWAPDVQRHYMGMNASDLAATVHAMYRPGRDVETCQQTMRDELIRAYRVEKVRAIPGARALVERLHGRVPMAVASGSPLSGIETAVAQLGIGPCLDHLISSEGLGRGKPAPDVFLAAAAALAVNPRSCLVFEDSHVGVEAATAAGMTCIVRPGLHAYGIENKASRVVASWDEVSVRDVFPT